MSLIDKVPIPENFPWLDGLRGTAAIWVVFSHVQILTGIQRIPVLSWGGLAVDLFMMLSGFLMAHHYLLREKTEPWTKPKSWNIFWLRRFFRIAPLYYFLLAVAFMLGPWIGEGRNAVATVYPFTATPSARYLDNSLANALLHITFVFGVLPQYSFRTPLPDWSIGLEMQFYFAFPFIMLLMKRVGVLVAGVTLVVACLALKWQYSGYFHEFEMPSFLPMKLYVFVIGIWISVGRTYDCNRLVLFASIAITSAIALYLRTSEATGLLVLVIALFYLMSDGKLPAPSFLLRGIDRLKSILSSHICRFLGDTSYGLYLVHLLVLIPIAGALAKYPTYVSAAGIVRFSVCLVVVLPLSLAIAWIGYKGIELPGIQLGKMIILKFAPRSKKA